MFCLAGLGNPGRQYQLTRHNAGFLVIEELARRGGFPLRTNGFHGIYGKGFLADQPVLLLQPQTFMNLSGQSVAAAVHYYKIPLENLLVIYDDLDLSVGMIRLRPSGSAAGHKGLTSIIQMLGSNVLPRLRVGIGRPPANHPVPDYVLTPFTPAEAPLIRESILRAADAATAFVSVGMEKAMNQYNQKKPPVEQPPA